MDRNTRNGWSVRGAALSWPLVTGIFLAAAIAPAGQSRAEEIHDLERVPVHADGAGLGGSSVSLSFSGGGGATTLDPVIVRGVRPNDKDDTVPTSSVLVDDVDPDPNRSCRGNPIIPATGNKIEPELDFASAGEMGLSLQRVYNHYWQGAGLFGKHWVSNFDYRITFGTTAIDSCYPRPGGGSCGIAANTVIYAWRPDGRTIKFVRNATDGVFYEAKASPIARIVKQADGSFLLHSETNGTERYSPAGYVTDVSNAQGVGWAFSYSGTYPTRVTHTSGRYIEFVWSSGRLTSVRDPAGNYYGYAYHANQFGAGLHRLASMSMPGSPATTITYHYEISTRPGALTGKSVNGARYSKFTYDSRGYATSTEHNGVSKYSFSYTPGSNGLLTVVETNPLGKKTTYTFQGGKPRTVTGHPSTYCPGSTYAETVYDSYGYPRLKSDFNGNDTLYTYNAKGQLLERVEAYGTPSPRTTQFTWDSSNRVMTETVVGLWRKTFDYDALNRLSRIRLTNLSAHGVPNQTRSTWLSYNYHAPISGNMGSVGMLASVSVDGPLPGTGDNSVVRYDAMGNLSSVWSGDGTDLTYSLHNALGRPGRVTNANGARIDYTRDARGRLTRVRTYLGGAAQDTNYAYDGDGRLVKVTTPDGVATDLAYFANDRDLLYSVSIDSNGLLAGGGTQEQRRFGYSLKGDPTLVTDYAVETYTVLRFRCLQPVGAPPSDCNEPDYYPEQVTGPVQKRSDSTLYDELGQVRARVGNNGQNVRYVYDHNGNVTAVTDSLSRVTSFSHDALGRLVKSVGPLNAVSEFSYDMGDRLTRVKDARGVVTSYVYDGFGQLWAQYSQDTGTTRFEYDAGGRLTRQTRNDGTATTYAYDSRDRLVSRLAGGQEHRFTYDSCTNGMGRLCGVWDPKGQLDYSYSPEGLLLAQTQRIGSSGIAFGQAYAYDGMGRMTGINYPGGVSVGYGYSYGRVKAMTVTINGSTRNVLTGIQYQPFGPAANWTYGNGMTRLMPRDMDGRLTGILSKNGSTSVQNLGFTYNANNAVTKLTNGASSALTQGFSYDAASRLTGVTASNANQAFAWDKTGNRTSHTWGGATDTYNTSATSNRLLSLSGPRPKSFTLSANGNVTAGAGASYTYDAHNRLVQAVKGGVTTSYWVNALGQRTYKTPAAPGTATGFVYGPSGLLDVEYNWSGSGWKHYLRLGGELVGLVRGGQLYYVHGDQLGRPELVTNASKAAV
ncbi:DUF6531 domain-containing protein [Lysobacter sp. A3-1-A15]|uniref:DUF6531 domain-containing protein n=1 Tax=Novilysobacter viscosus TaxID=3098602 RepID=UPI002EDB2D19